MAAKPPWADLTGEILLDIFQRVQLRPQNAEAEQISRQEVAMQTVCKAWSAAWVGLPLERRIELKSPKGKKSIEAAQRWLAKQGFSRLRDVSLGSILVLNMLAGCKKMRRMEVTIRR